MNTVLAYFLDNPQANVRFQRLSLSWQQQLHNIHNSLWALTGLYWRPSGKRATKAAFASGCQHPLKTLYQVTRGVLQLPKEY